MVLPGHRAVPVTGAGHLQIVEPAGLRAVQLRAAQPTATGGPDRASGTYLGVVNGAVSMSLVLNGAQQYFASGYALSTNVWHHVVGTDGVAMRIYVDGVLQRAPVAASGQ